MCEESGENEPAKDEVGLAASFPPPSQHFTTDKQCSSVQPWVNSFARKREDMCLQ